MDLCKFITLFSLLLCSKFSIIKMFYIIISKLDHLYYLSILIASVSFSLPITYTFVELIRKNSPFSTVSEFCLWLFCGMASHFKVVKFINIFFYKLHVISEKAFLLPFLLQVHKIHPGSV